MSHRSAGSDDEHILALLTQLERETQRPPGGEPSPIPENGDAEWLARARHLFKLFAVARSAPGSNKSCQRSDASTFGPHLADENLPDANSPAADRPLPIERIGSFRLLRQVGRGGCGVVYLGIDERLGRSVALKIPFPNVLSSDELRIRFLREAKAAAALAHPNIVAVFEAGEMPPVLFIASEYCSGGNLAEWLRGQANQPSAGVAARIVAALADAVAHAHARGILHRDLKPGNVLLEPRSNEAAETNRRDPLPFVPKLTDFGLAKFADEVSDTTKTGLLFGTLRYMAPEQARGQAGRIGPAADIYALGAILYELLVGRPPFVGDSEFDTLRQIQSDDPIAPGLLRPGLPRDLEAVCLKCLEKDSPRRYATAGELAADLERFLHGRPTQARPATAVERTWRWLRRRPLVVLSTVALVALVSLAGFAWQQAAQRARALRHSATLEARRMEVEYVADVRHVSQAFADLAAGSPQPTQPLRDLLAHHVPAAGEKDLRGFEWHYFWRLLHPHGSVLTGHADLVWSIDWSDDGRYLATASRDETARVWDAASGQQLLQFAIPGGASTVKFGPAGSYLAVGAEQNAIQLYSLPDGKLLRTLPGHQGDVLWLAPLPGQRSVLVSIGRTDAVLRGWDLTDGSQTFELSTELDVAWSASAAASGKTIAIAGKNGVRLVDLDARQIVKRRDFDSDSKAVKFSPDGRYLGVAADTRRLAVLAAETLAEVASFSPGYGVLESIEFSPDERRVSAAFGDLLFTWDIQTGELLSSLAAAKSTIITSAASSDGSRLAITDFSADVYLLDAGRTENPRKLITYLHGISDIQWHPDGRTLAICGRQILFSDCASGTTRQLFELEHACDDPWFVSCCFTPHGKHIVVLTHCPQRNVSLREFPSGKLLWQKTLPAKPAQAAVTPAGHLAVQTDRGLHFLELPSGQELRFFPASGHGAWYTATSGHPTLVFANGRLQEASIARPRSDKTLWELPPRNQYTLFSRDGSLMVHAYHGWLDVCLTRTAAPCFSTPQDVWYRNVDLTPDGRTLAYLSTAARRLHFCRLPHGDELASVRLPWPLLATTAVRCSPDGRRVALMHTGSDSSTGPAFVLVFDGSPQP